MIGVIVATHANLAVELLRAAEMIMGPFALVEAISIDRETSVESARQQMQESLARVGQDGDGVIVLTDMFGGTPTNIAAEFLAVGQLEILTGVNLPMLLKCISGRKSIALDEFARQLKDYGCSAVMRPAELIGR